jgi:oligopeptide/dipeptide ABC transporter ATP-binding protein
MLFNVKNLKIDFYTNYGILNAVRNVSFTLGEGEILGIVGESGSGKSVTALSLLKLLPGNSRIDGNILFADKDILKFNKKELREYRGNNIGIIFQEPGRSFDPIYTIGKSINEAIMTHNPELIKEKVYEKSISLLKEVNIPNPEERVKNFPHQFSGGLLQRIMIAISLAGDPEVLIADEPTTALDVTIQAQIIDLLMRLKETRKLSIIFISHNLSLIGSISNKMIVMYGGLILEEGETEDILKNTYHPYTRALLDSLPVFGEYYTNYKLRTIPGSVPNPLHPEPGCPFAPRCSLTRPECITKIPDLIKDSHYYRCIIPGVKK